MLRKVIIFVVLMLFGVLSLGHNNIYAIVEESGGCICKGEGPPYTDCPRSECYYNTGCSSEVSSGNEPFWYCPSCNYAKPRKEKDGVYKGRNLYYCSQRKSDTDTEINIEGSGEIILFFKKHSGNCDTRARIIFGDKTIYIHEAKLDKNSDDIKIKSYNDWRVVHTGIKIEGEKDLKFRIIDNIPTNAGDYKKGETHISPGWESVEQIILEDGTLGPESYCHGFGLDRNDYPTFLLSQEWKGAHDNFNTYISGKPGYSNYKTTCWGDADYADEAGWDFNDLFVTIGIKELDSPPEISSNLPTCEAEHTFEVKLSDAQGADTIDSFDMDIEGNNFTVDNIDISEESATVDPASSGDLTASIEGFQIIDENKLRVDVKIAGLDNLPGTENASLEFIAYDSTGKEGKKSYTFPIGTKPVPSFAVYDAKEGGINFDWAIENNDPNETDNNNCSVSKESGPGSVNCDPIPSSCRDEKVASSFQEDGEEKIVCYVDQVGEYNFSFKTENVCGSNETQLNFKVGDPWMMTLFGDVFSQGGFSNMKMKVIGDAYTVPSWAKGQPIGSNDSAWFSTYIMSKMDNNWTANRGSLSGYDTGDSYDDGNRALFDSSLYNYLYDIVKNNGYEITEFSDIPNSICSADETKVIFIKDTSNPNEWKEIGSGWDGEKSDSRACVIISDSPVRINSNVNNLDALIISSKTIETTDENIPFVNNGSILANKINFQRNLSGLANEGNPSELVVYDAKYLVLLRDILGIDYSSKVREFQYSDVAE